MVAPVLLAVVLGTAYLVWAPQTADLAAQTFRSDLFASHGFLIWNNDWYAGHYLPGYSLVSPALGALLGPQLLGALAAVATVALFTAIAMHWVGERARLGVMWFAVAVLTELLSNRITFAVGVAIGLGALLALQRRPGALLASGLAALTAVASPVAGLFLAVAAAAVAIAGDRRRGLAMVGASLAGIAIPSLMFPTGGVEPFVFSTFVGVPVAAAILLVLVPREERVLRIGTWLYLGLTVALFLFATPVGGNATRLAALFAGPVLALVLAGRRNVALALAAPVLLYSQWVFAVRDVSVTLGEPSVHASYYAPLVAELRTLPGGRSPSAVRIEIPPTRNRWEAAYVAPEFPLARGWLRQAESGDFDLFTGDELTPAAYRSWLDERGVSYVALPDAALDYLATDEAALIRSGLPYLREVWSNDHWALYHVRQPTPLAQPPARLVETGPDWFRLEVPRGGSYLVRIHYTRYFSASDGACVEPSGDWTRVVAPTAGSIKVEASFSIGRLFGGDASCSG